MQKLSMKFEGLIAVEDYSVEVYPGEIIGIIGPNGAGKTTVFNMLTGFLTPTSSRINLLGQDQLHNSYGLLPCILNLKSFREKERAIRP